MATLGLVNFLTEIKTSNKIQETSLNIYTEMTKTFVESAFPETMSRCFYWPIHRSNIKKLSDIKHVKTKFKCIPGETVQWHKPRDDGTMLRRSI